MSGLEFCQLVEEVVAARAGSWNGDASTDADYCRARVRAAIKRSGYYSLAHRQFIYGERYAAREMLHRAASAAGF